MLVLIKFSEFSVTADSIYNTLVVKYKMVVYTLKGSAFKGSIIERFNRTLKTRIARYFTEHGTTRWLDVLQGITAAYNKSYHRSIKMSPNDASLLKVKYNYTVRILKKLFRTGIKFLRLYTPDEKLSQFVR